MPLYRERPKGPHCTGKVVSDHLNKSEYWYSVYWDSDPSQKGTVSVTVSGPDVHNPLMDHYIAAHVLYFQNVTYQMTSSLVINQKDAVIVIRKEN